MQINHKYKTCIAAMILSAVTGAAYAEMDKQQQKQPDDYQQECQDRDKPNFGKVIGGYNYPRSVRFAIRNRSTIEDDPAGRYGMLGIA